MEGKEKMTIPMTVLADVLPPGCEGDNCVLGIGAVSLVAGLVLGFLLGRMTARKRPSAAAARPQAKNTPDAAQRQRRAAERRPEPPPREPLPEGAVELYVGNLSYDTADAQLLELFSQHGTVTSARVVTNRYNGKSKGFAFVVMAERAAAEKAAAALNDVEFQGRKLRVNIAKSGNA